MFPNSDMNTEWRKVFLYIEFTDWEDNVDYNF